jgi:cyclophilin family peptidyl-prolyl cis-trans isomerase
MKGPEPAEAGPVAPSRWMARLNEFGEQHARVIISISTALIILTVLLFAKYFYDKAMVEHADQDLAQAETIDRLKDIKQRYSAYPAAALATYKLANKYYDEGRLAEAKAEYQEFKSRFPGHPMTALVERAAGSLEKNMKFEEQQKTLRLKESSLQTHPRTLPQSKDPRLQWNPLPQPRPVAELETPTGSVKIELFEDEAPNAVANFVKRAELKHWDGAKVDLENTDEALVVRKDAEGTLPAEATALPGTAGSLVLLADRPAGAFKVLLKDVADLKDATVFGIVTEGLERLKSLKKDDALKAVRIASKRDRPYEPEIQKK